MSKEQDLAKLKKLTYGSKETVYINWFEEGGCSVDRVEDVFVMHCIPQYGGEPEYIDTYHLNQFEELLTKAHSFT